MTSRYLLLKLLSTSEIRISLTSGEYPHVYQRPIIFFPQTWAELITELCQYSRPICLGEDEDLSLNLETRTGAVAGWGTTVVDYEYSQCGYKKGVTRPDSLSKVLKKLLGLR